MMLKTTLLGGFVAATAMVGAIANASTFAPRISVTVWSASHLTNPGCSNPMDNCPYQEALPSNPIASSSNEIATFTLSALPYWDIQTQADNTLGQFINATYDSSTSSWTLPSDISGFTAHNGLSVSQALATVTSTGQFSTATLMDFNVQGSIAGSYSFSGVIRHDDGISIFANGNPNPIVNSANPTSATNTPFTISGSGAYDYNLWYLAANGAPEVLQVSLTSSTVPEPGTLALFAASLIGLGLAAARRRRV